MQPQQITESAEKINTLSMPGLSVALSELLKQMNQSHYITTADLDQLVELVSTATTQELSNASRSLKLQLIPDLKPDVVIAFLNALPDDFELRKDAARIVSKSDALESISVLTMRSHVDYRNVLDGAKQLKINGVKATIALGASFAVPTQFGIADWLAEYLVDGKNLRTN